MFTAKEFARFNINSSAVPKIFTGGKMNVELLIFNLINFDDSKLLRSKDISCKIPNFIEIYRQRIAHTKTR